MPTATLSLCLLLTGAPARADLPPRTIDSLREDLNRDFPPGSGTTAVIAPVVIQADGTVAAQDLGERELAFLSRVFRKMKYGPDRRLHKVTLRFTRPAAYAVSSFVEEDERGRIRMVQGLKIVENADGEITTISPYFPPDAPPATGFQRRGRS